MSIPFLDFTVNFERDGGAWVKRPALSGNMASSVTKRAISWFFDGGYTVGQYITGDWWVLDEGGGVVINSITPTPGGGRNGTMINPVPANNSPVMGFDDRTVGDVYVDTTPAFPYTASAGESICSSESLPSVEDEKYVKYVEILTVVSSIPAADAFRPPYHDTPKNTEYRESQVDYSLLQNLPLPAGETLSDMVVLHDWYQRPQIELSMGPNSKTTMVEYNSPADYGRDIGFSIGRCFLALNTVGNLEDKKPLAIAMIQYGIDCHSVILSGQRFKSDGGIMCGRKLQTVFAGKALNSAEILANVAGSNLKFQEDGQYFIVTQYEYDLTNNLLPEGPAWDPDDRHHTPMPYTVESIGKADWGVRHDYLPQYDNYAWGAKYRYTATVSLIASFVCAKLMGMEDDWDHPPFFEFVEKWIAMTWPIGVVATIDDLPPGAVMSPGYAGGGTADTIDHHAVALYLTHIKAF